ncbi:uncharacterized protein MONOS_13883 [Monocercomonoides exilis]|uniref:uncharacterized protein n=1 Tax=Monocercomonoides exilis TaxID=2049356 RepID=UPI0035595772|nr:hypothetical protein MONOS_13883 [Monocercomonoides exilis]|eukprot:MONOS_13883.1-p1 / transcript=MONOS_13883.1 / gene=MONOS_13883 / organism=Monocercomonoides_exilis_PA203 / gene_product=unspecified product / transcript_product=unspecified product / location=Mono_scaffold00898:20948-21151(-) / protein_length=68 / sequence_SO=supercontig / SO=protein_coding / is_pseudo=false
MGCAASGVVHSSDAAISVMFSFPLITLLPSLAASMDTMSGSKQIFVVEEVNAFTSIYDLFDMSLQIW